MVPSALPDGLPAPDDGALPDWVAGLPDAGRGVGVYLHVPFCAVRCGYCDFNTYTASQLGGGASQASYADTLLTEVELARRVLADAGRGGRPVQTVFVGGGTPTVLPPGDLARMLDAVRGAWGLAPGAEVTTEANPDSVTPDSLAALARGGFTRVSFGMQSAVPHVLATLERTHDPINVAKAVQAAKTAGLHVSVDLIYGTPGESMMDWRTSLEAAVDLDPDHISAYALVVEEGTKLGAQVRRGQVPAPDDDDEAAKYELADEVLGTAGYGWYEVSNWARTEADRCRHNEGYWLDGDWWGVGPGAHSHVGGIRWWNVKPPHAFASRLHEGPSPAAGRELLTDEQRYDERLLLGVRLLEGLPIDVLRPDGVVAVPGLVADGLVADGLLDGPSAKRPRRVVLTLRGRLLADTVVRRLLGF